MDAIKSQESNKKQPVRVQTKLKFIKSEQTGAIIGFVSQNPKTGRICGVRQDSEYPKKIAILDKKLIPEVLLNVLYDVEMIPMSEKNGYVVISISPVQFKASIHMVYVKKAIYRVECKFGNKVVEFDPMDGKRESVRSLPVCISILEKRVDIKDVTQVVADFQEAGNRLLNLMRADGILYKN